MHGVLDECEVVRSLLNHLLDYMCVMPDLKLSVRLTCIIWCKVGVK